MPGAGRRGGCAQKGGGEARAVAAAACVDGSGRDGDAVMAVVGTVPSSTDASNSSASAARNVSSEAPATSCDVDLPAAP